MDREELINGYFEGVLNDAQHQQFLHFIRNDAAFAEEVAYRKQVKQAIHLEERASLKRKLQTYEQEQKVHHKNSSIFRWLSAAAAILLVGISVLWWYGNNAKNSLYERYYETFPNIVQPLVRGENQVDARSTAFLNYDRGQYQQSAEFFSQSADNTELFYGALSEMELGQHQKALTIFKRINTSGATTLERYILWYRALNLLKLGHNEEALKILSVLEREKDFELAAKVSSLKSELRP